MIETLTAPTTRIALELHEFLRDLDAAGLRGKVGASMWRRLTAIEDTVTQIVDACAASSDPSPPLYYRLTELALLIRDYTPDPGLSAEMARRQWVAFRKAMVPAYESLVVGLRAERVRVPSLRPTNYARNIFHICGMVFVLFLVEYVLSAAGMVITAGICAAICWMLEYFRRGNDRLNGYLMWFFQKIAHPTEVHRVNSSTWMVTSLFILSLMYRPITAAIAVVVLGLGDAAAGFIGRRFGRTPLLHGRSLEGSLAFVGAGFAAVSAFLYFFHPEVPWSAALPMAAAATVAGALAEIFSRRLDDNLTIPVSAATAGIAMAYVVGLPV